MQRRKAWIGSFLCFALCSGSLYAQTAAPNVSVSVRFFDQRVYYVDNDPIFVQVTVTNNGPGTYRFKLADERAFTVDFDVRTLTNRAVPLADVLERKRTRAGQIFFRDVIVESGESFSFVEDLRAYAALDSSGSFVVQARLYPELYRSTGTASATAATTVTGAAISASASGAASYVESNRLRLNLRPSLMPGPDGLPLELDVETNAILVREQLAPDEVIHYMLTARQRSQWEKFFLYLDLEAMVSRDGARERQWRAESEEGRQRMIARYRADLQAAVIDGDIAAIPTEYEIERTSYGTMAGTVVVLEKFRGSNYTERKRFTYYLERENDIWTIVDYTVMNLGTE
jgi:hypothetical protein